MRKYEHIYKAVIEIFTNGQSAGMAMLVRDFPTANSALSAGEQYCFGRTHITEVREYDMKRTSGNVMWRIAARKADSVLDSIRDACIEGDAAPSEMLCHILNDKKDPLHEVAGRLTDEELASLRDWAEECAASDKGPFAEDAFLAGEEPFFDFETDEQEEDSDAVYRKMTRNSIRCLLGILENLSCESRAAVRRLLSGASIDSRSEISETADRLMAGEISTDEAWERIGGYFNSLDEGVENPYIPCIRLTEPSGFVLEKPVPGGHFAVCAGGQEPLIYTGYQPDSDTICDGTLNDGWIDLAVFGTTGTQEQGPGNRDITMRIWPDAFCESYRCAYLIRRKDLEDRWTYGLLPNDMYLTEEEQFRRTLAVTEVPPYVANLPDGYIPL